MQGFLYRFGRVLYCRRILRIAVLCLSLDYNYGGNGIRGRSHDGGSYVGFQMAYMDEGKAQRSFGA